LTDPAAPVADSVLPVANPAPATPGAAATPRGKLAWLRSHWRDPLYRNGYYLMLNSLTGAGFGFLFWMVAARLYTQAEVGTAVGVVSAMTLAALFGKFGVDAALIRYVPTADRRGRLKLLAESLALTSVLTLTLAVGMVGLFPTLSPALAALHARPLDAALFCAFAVLMSGAWVLDGYFIAERRAGLSLLRNVTFNALKVALPFVGVIAASSFALPLAWGLGIAASVAVAALAVPRLLQRVAPTGGAALPARRTFLAYSGANYVVNVTEWLPTLVLPLLVLAVAGPEQNAVFYMAWTLASLAFFFTKAVSQSTFAEMSHQPENLAPLLRKGAKHSGLVVAPTLLGGALLGGVALSLFGPTYRDQGYPLLLVLLGSGVFVAVSNLYLTLLKARDARVELVLLPTLLLAATVTAAYAALGAFGLMGLAWAWLLTNALGAGYCLIRIPTHLRRSATCRESAPLPSA